MDRNTMQVTKIWNAGSRVERSRLGDDPVSRAVRKVETEGIREGETRLIMLSVRRKDSREPVSPFSNR